jgi:hypothetical protein
VENNFGCENALLLSVMFREEMGCGDDFGGYAFKRAKPAFQLRTT